MKDLESLPRLYIRGFIGPKDGFMDMFGGESFSASDVRDFLQANKEATEIVAEISSDGGFKTEGVEIFNLLRNSGKKVTTIGYKVNSIATVIMLAGDTRLIVEHSQFVVHFARIDPMNLGMDPLTADDFQRLAAETERSDREIVDIYCSVLGEEKRMELVAAMGSETDLGAKGAIKLGFATGYYKKAKKEKVTEDDFRGALITDHLAQIIQNNMSKEKEQQDKLSKLEVLMNAGFAKIGKMFSKIKNEVTLPVQGGGSVYLVPVDPNMPDELMGAKAYSVDEAGLPTETPYPDGTVTLEDGRTLTIAAGAVTQVSAVVDAKKLQEEKAALETANAALQAQINELQAKHTASLDEAKKEVVAIQNAFAEYKKLIPGDGKEKEKDEPAPLDFSKMTTAQRVRAMSKEREKLEYLKK